MNYDAWKSRPAISESSTAMAVDAWEAIKLNPTTIDLINRPVTLTVVLAYDSGSPNFNVIGPASQQIRRTLVLLGVYGHPDPSVVDTDIRAKDRFVKDDVEFEVLDMFKTKGQLQCRCQALT